VPGKRPRWFRHPPPVEGGRGAGACALSR
jgi:hypothetical protein